MPSFSGLTLAAPESCNAQAVTCCPLFNECGSLIARNIHDNIALVCHQRCKSFALGRSVERGHEPGLHVVWYVLFYKHTIKRPPWQKLLYLGQGVRDCRYIRQCGHRFGVHDGKHAHFAGLNLRGSG